MRHITPAILAFAALAGAARAEAPAIPEKIGFQGRLTGASGNPVSGPVSLTFKLYSETGEEKWSSGPRNVALDNGLYNVALGNPALGSLTFQEPYLLGITVGTDAEMTPRYPLLAVPYAMRAKRADDADRLDGKAAPSYLDLDQHTGTLSLARGGTGSTSLPAGSVIFSGGTTLTHDSANLFWDDVNDRLGIGTASPGSRLTVGGTIETTAGGVKFPDGTTQTTAAATIPSGYSILAPTPASPAGYTLTGETVLGGWISTAPLATGRSWVAAGSVNGKVYIFGGNNGATFSLTEEFDPVSNTWSGKAPLLTPRHGAVAGVVEGKIYVIGGYNGSAINSKCEMYDPVADTWTEKTPMPTARYGAVAGVVDGRIFVIGGSNASNLATCEEYDPGLDAWTTRKAMSTNRFAAAGGAVNGRIYVFGGYNSSPLYTCEEYDPATDTWRARAPLSSARLGHTAGVINGKIYSLGGLLGSESLAICEEFDPSNNAWALKTPMPTARYQATACDVNGKILVIGGFKSGPGYLSTCEEYIAEKRYYVHTKN